MSTILYKNKNIIIEYDDPTTCLLVEWHGLIKSDEFREAATQIIKYIENTKAKFILSDNTHWKAISPNDHGWAANNWFPLAEALGVRKLATVLSNDYFNRFAERSIEGMAEVDCMQIRNFNTKEEAFNWIKQSKRVENCL